MRSGYISNQVIVVRVVDSGREVESKGSENVRSRTMVEALALVFEPREMTLQTGYACLLSQSIVYDKQKLTQARRYASGFHPGY